MLPFLTQPAVAPACYVPKVGIGAQSLLFRADPAYLQRVPAMAGNRKLACLDACVTPVNQGVNRSLLVAGDSTADYVYMDIAATNLLRINIVVSGTVKVNLSAVPVFHDVATYHLRVVLDVENAIAADRVRLYQDGTRLAISGLLNLATTDLLALNNTVTHRIGRTTLNGYTNQFAGLMADVVLVAGSVPAHFGERNIHGVWVRKPKTEIQAAVAAAGGFGSHGFHLDFSDPLNPGKDVSGKGNNFTAVGFDAAGKDTVASSPTNRYATLSPLWRVSVGNGTTPTVAGGGLEATIPPVNSGVRADLAVKAGKWYWCGRFTTLPNYCLVGVTRGGASATWNVEGIHYTNHLGVVYVDGVQVATWATWSSADTIAVALDLDAETATFYKNGVLQGTVTLPASDTGWVPAFSVSNSTTSAYVAANFGQRDWGSYPPPAGFKPLCTDNLPEPAIKDPAEALAQATATGANMVAVLDAVTAHWSGQWVEIVKRRDVSEDWRLRFSDDPANAWATNTTSPKAAAPALAAGGSYVGHRLRVGKRYGVWTAEVAHTTGTATTVTHNLATARNAVIATRVSAGGGERYMRHPDLTAGCLLKLNAEAAETADATLTAFGANSFQIAGTAPSGTYRVLVLAQRDGCLDLGKWAGTGMAGADGPFAPTTTLPVWSFYKRTNAVCSWFANDAARDPANVLTRTLSFNYPKSEDLQTVNYLADFVTGGVKVRSDNGDINAAGGTYVFVAIGRPIGGVCVAPATAR